MLVRCFHLATTELHLRHENEDELREKEPNQRLETLDVRRIQNKVEGDGCIAVHDVPDVEIAVSRVSFHHRIGVQAEFGDGSREYRGRLLFSAVHHLIRYLLHDGMARILPNRAIRIIERIPITFMCRLLPLPGHLLITAARELV